MKKVLSMFMALVMLCTMTVGLDFSASAQVSGDAEYTMLDNHKTVAVKKPKKVKLKKVSVNGKILKVYWNKINKSTGYQIQYSTSKKFAKKATNTVNVKGYKSTSKTIKNIKSGKKYYVRIRAYNKAKVNSRVKTAYGSWSKMKTVTTKQFKSSNELKTLLLNYYWKNSIQSPTMCEFNSDNTVIEYRALPNEPKSSWSVSRKGKYTLNNNKLTLNFSDKYGKYTCVLYYVSFKENIDWDWGLHLDEKIGSNEHFFYEKGFKPATNGPSGNATYLAKGTKK